MNRKKLMVLFITGIMLLSASNVIAAQNNATDTLDIEKTAIEVIKNNQSVKTYNENTDNAQKQYDNAKAASQMALSSGRNLIQAVILNPIEAENAYKKFTTSKDVNTNSVRIDAYSKYISLLKANYAVNIQQELADNLYQDNKKTQEQLNNGLISKNDARLVEINYLKSLYQLNSLKNTLNSAYMTVNLATGEDISKRYAKLMDNNIEPVSQIKPLNDYVKDALANRGEIINDQNTLDAKKKEFEYVNATLYTDYQFYAKKTQYDIDSAQNTLDEDKIQIQIEITNGYKTLEGDMKAIESQQANYDLAEANYESAKIQYNNSMITLEQFQNAEIAKAQAQMNLKNAQLDAWLEQIKMSNATGIGPALK